MAKKTSMIFYYDWLALFEEMSDTEVRQLIEAAVKYDEEGEDTYFDDKGMRVAFTSMKNSIDISNKKYGATCEKRKKAAEKRWEMQMHANDANASKCMQTMQMHANDADIDIDTDIEIEIDTPPISRSRGKPTASKLIEERRFPEQVEAAVKDWVKYKIEKRQGYKEIGLRNFLSMIENKLKGVPPDTVVECIRSSMANNWQGIVWDREQPAKKETKFTTFEQRDYDYAALEKKLFGG